LSFRLEIHLAKHVEQIANADEKKLDEMLTTVFDIEHLIALSQSEKDVEAKFIYIYLHKSLKKSLAGSTTLLVDNPLGVPPFEKPNLSQIILYYIKK